MIPNKFFLIVASIIFAGSVMMSGCTAGISQPALIDQGAVQVITHNSTRLASYIKEAKPGLWICKENITDAVKTRQENLNLSGVGSAASKSIGEGVSSGALSLGGMNPEVLITSELLYRACEMSANLNADKELTFKIYRMFLNSVNQTSANQTSSGAKALDSKLTTSNSNLSDGSNSSDAPEASSETDPEDDSDS